ncbi:NEP1-interacting protein-like 1 isoform X2 [Actinidia eriantha]|uniref:NEP1-interacting protein-like 1 isoform X2 n=1 Tax=Actinidia eriantha TaxID=165200 RepID=UPI00258C9922|nr:NEP1-interacting protein-like 1 isoform X2 [Actinidia eriantha]
MEVCACPTRPRQARLSSLMWWVCADQRSIEFCSALVSAVLRSLFYAIFTSFFGVVGTTVGAMTGAVSGLKNKRGFFHGAAIGAIAGAYFSVEFVKASFDFFNSYDDGPLSFLQFIDVITSLFNPTLLYLGEKFGPIRNQVGTVETIHEVPRFINNKREDLLYRGSADRLPKIRITDKNIYDASGNRISCSVCLEDFQVGEVVGSLPLCHHMFHRPCIAKWRTRHSSCPLCRRNQ